MTTSKEGRVRPALAGPPLIRFGFWNLEHLGQSEYVECLARRPRQVDDPQRAALHLEQPLGINEHRYAGGVDELQAVAIEHQVIGRQSDEYEEPLLKPRCCREVDIAADCK